MEKLSYYERDKRREYSRNYYHKHKKEINARRKEYWRLYNKRPEVRAKRIKYMREYMKEYATRPEVRERQRLYRMSKGISTNNYTDYPSLSLCVQLCNYVGSANNPYTLNELCVRECDYIDVIDLISNM